MTETRKFKVLDSTGLAFGLDFTGMVLDYYKDAPDSMGGGVVLHQPQEDRNGRTCMGVVVMKHESVREVAVESDKKLLASLLTIPKETADEWANIANLLSEASRLIEEAHTTLLLDLNITDGKPLEAIDKARDALSGLSYMFTPQTEWTGGDSSDPKNFKFNLPHIARGVLNEG